MTTQAEVTAVEVPFANTELSFRAAALAVHNLIQAATELSGSEKFMENKAYNLMLGTMTSYHDAVSNLATSKGFTIQSGGGPKT